MALHFGQNKAGSMFSSHTWTWEYAMAADCDYADHDCHDPPLGGGHGHVLDTWWSINSII